MTVPIGEAPISFYVDTNIGSQPVTVCSCGVIVHQAMFHEHAALCANYQEKKGDAPVIEEQSPPIEEPTNGEEQETNP